MMQCRNCRFCWSAPLRPDVEAGEPYRHVHAAPPIVLRKNILLAEDYWEKIERFLGETPSRILEIGGGFGHFSQKLREQGFAVTLNEINPEAVEHAQSKLRLPTLAGSFTEIGQDETFDLIFAGHVIEHLADPALLLQHAQRLLRLGGKLILLTPNADAWKFRLFGPAWCWASPDHLSFLSMTSARDLLSRHSFEIEEIASLPAHPCHYPGLLVGLVSRLKNIWKGRRSHRVSAEEIETNMAGARLKSTAQRPVDKLFRLLNGLAAREARLFRALDRRPGQGDELLTVAQKR